ncbi:MAG: hypothetical protein IVW57_16455 [Ktedonobacterales bacterium]|nr:hypothetical protein [Ktedonobacterales bacterium]
MWASLVSYWPVAQTVTYPLARLLGSWTQHTRIVIHSSMALADWVIALKKYAPSP